MFFVKKLVYFFHSHEQPIFKTYFKINFTNVFILDSTAIAYKYNKIAIRERSEKLNRQLIFKICYKTIYYTP